MTEGVRQKIACMHLSFLFDCERTKRKLSQILDWDKESLVWHLPRCEMHAKAHEHYKTTRRKQKAPEKQQWQTQLNCHIHVDKWAVWHLQNVVQVHAMQSEWGYNWLSQRASGQPDRRRSSLLTTVWCKRLEMMLLKRWIKQNWTGNKWNKEGETNTWTKKLKRIRKVSRRVPTAISLFL